MQAHRIILNNEHQYKFVEVCCALFCYPGVDLKNDKPLSNGFLSKIVIFPSKSAYAKL